MAEPNGYEHFEVDQHIVAQCRYYVGKIGSRFYEALGDEKKILGVKCQTCDSVYWPPRATCGRCFAVLSETDLVEIGPRGSLETFTKIDYHEPVHPRKGPLIYGVIKLEGADSGLAHLIGEADFDKLYIGMPMTPVFSETPKGNILDIEYFKPA